MATWHFPPRTGRSSAGPLPATPSTICGRAFRGGGRPAPRRSRSWPPRPQGNSQDRQETMSRRHAIAELAELWDSLPELVGEDWPGLAPRLIAAVDLLP